MADIDSRDVDPRTGRLPPFFTFTLERDGKTKLTLNAISIRDQETLGQLINMLEKMKTFLNTKEPGAA